MVAVSIQLGKKVIGWVANRAKMDVLLAAIGDVNTFDIGYSGALAVVFLYFLGGG